MRRTIVPIDLIRREQVEGCQPFHLHLLEVRMAKKDISVHAENPRPGEVLQMVLLFPFPRLG